MKAYEAIGATLHELGVTTLFGLLGDGNIKFALAAEENGIRYLGARHESAAVAMADGYTRVAQQVGVASVTTGPGVTNTLTALGEAVRARTPILLLTGATSNTLEDYPQLIDQDGLVRALGVGVQRFRGPQYAVVDLIAAYRRAMLERRPIMYSIPTDAQDVEVGSLPNVRVPVSPSRRIPAEAELERVLSLIAKARRPVILAGWGAVLSGAQEALHALGRRLDAVVTTSATAKGFFVGEPGNIGTSGGFSSERAAAILETADLVLSFGASLNQWTTRGGTLYGDAGIVQVEEDPTAIEYFVRGVTPLLGDARETAYTILRALELRDPAPSGFVQELDPAELASARRGDPFIDESDEHTIDPRTLTTELNALLPEQSITLTDSGAFMGFAGSYFEPKRLGGFLFLQGFQAVGLALAQSIGTAVAGPGSLPVTMIGDGGLFMSLGELETITRVGTPHLVVVYNDAAYGAEVHVGRHHGIETDIVRFPDWDLVSLARGAGGDGCTVRRRQDLDALRSWLERPDGLFLLDCKTDVRIPAPLWAEFFRNHK